MGHVQNHNWHSVAGSEKWPLGRLSVVRLWNTTEYHVGWFASDGCKLNTGIALMLRMIKKIKERGVSYFDVGGISPGNNYSLKGR